MSEAENVLYYGRTDEPPEKKELRAGPLSVTFEDGDLRFFRLGEVEVLRRIYITARDRDWNTIPAVVSEPTIDMNQNSFRIEFQAENKQGDFDFAWKGLFSGSADGSISYSMIGEARRSFYKNRLGICVLHPLRGIVANPVEIPQPDGTIESGRFPYFILPQRPFMNIAGIDQVIFPGVKYKLRFEGEVFEMEDQRNYGDGSFKTYCTPQDLPMPVEVKAGQKIYQTVKFSIEMPSHIQVPSTSAPIVITPEYGMHSNLPAIGLCMASHGMPLTDSELDLLRRISLSHIRVDIDFSSKDWQSDLAEASRQASSLGAGLEVAAITGVDAENELRSLAAELTRTNLDAVTCLVFHKGEEATSEKWILLARDILRSSRRSVRIGGGSNGDFDELNRNRPNPAAMDVVCFPITVQNHLTDNSTPFENLEGCYWTTSSARQFCGNAFLAVTPVTLRRRPSPPPAAYRRSTTDQLPSHVDPRQMSLFGSSWTAGSIKSFAEAGASSVTYFETTGWLGVMESESGSVNPEKFRSQPGMVFPLYHILADVGEMSGGSVIGTNSSSPFAVQALTIRRGSRNRTLVFNKSAEVQDVLLSNVSASIAYTRELNEKTTEAAMLTPSAFRTQETATEVARNSLKFRLLPFEVRRIDHVS